MHLHNDYAKFMQSDYAKLCKLWYHCKRGSKVAASKGSFRSCKLKAIQSKEDWCPWASKAAIQTRGDEDACGEVGHDESNGHGDPIHAAMMEAQVCIEGHISNPVGKYVWVCQKVGGISVGI
jgi:hypothetical protein